MKRFSLHKSERLCSQKTIGGLFTSGDTFLSYPLKVVFLRTEATQAYPALAAFSVSKRNFKRAVKRNLLKRRMREAYRLHKDQLYSVLDERGVFIAVMFIFVGKEVCEYDQIEKGMTAAIKKIASIIGRNPGKQNA